MTEYDLAWPAHFLPSPGLGCFLPLPWHPWKKILEQAFWAPLHQGPSMAGRMMRCPNEGICRAALFGVVLWLMFLCLMGLSEQQRCLINLDYPVWQLSSAQPLSLLPPLHGYNRAAVKGFLLSLFLLSALLSVLCKQETANTTDKQICRLKEREAISLPKRKGRWSCVNVSCFLHNMKCWDGRKYFYEHSNKTALAKLLWSGASCWWILLAERMW